MNQFWPSVFLTDICNPKQWPTISQADLAPSGYPVYGANGKIGYYSDYNHEKETLLITCRGATCGSLNICEPYSYVTGNSMALDDLDEKRVDQKFLYFTLLSRGLKETITGSAQPQITRQSLSKVSFPLPPLLEQRRIAAILDKADAVRRKRQESIRLTEEFLHSVFLDMFGDPVTNPKGWEVKKFGEICDCRLGKMLDGKQQTGNYPKKYLRNTNVQWGRFDLSEVFEMDFNEKDQTEFRLRQGDVLICEGGEVGRSAVWYEELSECYFQKALHRARPHKSSATPEYIANLMWFLAEYGGLKDHTTSATIAHLTGVKLKGMDIPVPPFYLQERFDALVIKTRKTKSLMAKRFAIEGDLFNSLVQTAFRGVL